MEELNEKMGINKFLLMVKGICFSMCATLIMILVLSMVLSFTNVKENVIMPTVIFISSFSILMGGFLVAKKVSEKGIIYGSVLGFCYMLLLYLISSIMNFNFSLNANAIMMIVFGVIGGAIGGVLGVNLK